VPPRQAPTADRFKNDENDYPDEPEEERRPRSRRRDDDDEEEERPARSRRSRDDDDEDDKPALGDGWAAFNKVRERTGSGDFPDEYKFPALGEDEGLFKFIDDAPFATFAQHWIDDIPGKKSWICVGDDCPLCDIGDSPAAIACFNVIDMLEPKPKVKMLVARITVAQQIANFAKQTATKPIDKETLYWAVSKSGTKKKQTTNLRPVKARDVDEDFKVSPLNDDEIDELLKKKFTKKNVPTHGRDKLQEVADIATGRD
jgi:hypothetical protein